MSEVVTSTPAVSNFEKLKAKLRELFELDKADLDFGIYRILRQRHAEITEFLDKHLEKTVREALTSHGAVQNQQVKQDLETAEENARRLGIAPEQSPKVIELRAKYKAGADLDTTANEVYSHLFTFFSRYYQEGDFIGLPRSTVQGREKYMIPYNGEEVKLIWANMDQYYIKSSEMLRDYTFRIRRADLNIMQPTLLQPSDDEPEEVVIHFKLVEGDTEKDNRKPNGKTTRAFILDAGQPFAESDDVTLNIRFCYREHGAEPYLQRKLNDLTEKTLANTLPPKWQRLLLVSDTTYKGKDTRSVLQKRLRDYTARHQFDYFIHKDLSGFLRRELDFYIKNEMMHLDDIEELTSPKAEEYLSKIRALRRCALPVIRMLAQLEDFQKKLWLKKKFVVETRYCLTIDRVPKELYEEICVNDAQWTEWEQLYAISEIEQNLLTAKLRTSAFLSQHPYLMLDTRHFNREFTLRLLATLDNLEETLDGVCFHSENFQALQLMQEQYQEQIKCVYIDPPYNATATEILYKNDYKHSSWVSFLFDRVTLARFLVDYSGLICITIDDYEVTNLQKIMDISWRPNNYLATVLIRNNPSGRSTVKGFAINHEYGLFYARDIDLVQVGRLPHSEEQKSRYDLVDSNGLHYEWENFRKNSSGSDREDRPKQYYPLFYNSKKSTLRVPKLVWDQHLLSWDLVEQPGESEQVLFPMGKDENEEKVWRYGIERTLNEIHDFKVEEKDGRIEIYKKKYVNEEGSLPRTWWDNPGYSARDNGTRAISNLFGSKSEFDFPKAPRAVEDTLRIGCPISTGTTLDFFAGSGTTGHAVINLNRSEEDSSRKYILVEMGEHFDTVLVPRLKKVVYSTDWRDGKPQNRDTGISHAFKIIRLESYEDTLNNLHLQRTPEQTVVLQRADEAQRAEYMVGYFLDVESAGSASLLNVKQFRDPFNYQMQITTKSAGETKATRIDLVETFNWLLGLKVKHIDAQGAFLSVSGEQRSGSRTLIIWRTLSDDLEADNLALEKYLSRPELNSAAIEFNFIYVNGSHTLHDPHKKIHLIEEVFQRRMFENGTFESLR